MTSQNIINNRNSIAFHDDISGTDFSIISSTEANFIDISNNLDVQGNVNIGGSLSVTDGVKIRNDDAPNDEIQVVTKLGASISVILEDVQITSQTDELAITSTTLVLESGGNIEKLSNSIGVINGSEPNSAIHIGGRNPVSGNFEAYTMTGNNLLRTDLSSIDKIQILSNNGIAGDGCQRVCVASDNLPFNIITQRNQFNQIKVSNSVLLFNDGFLFDVNANIWRNNIISGAGSSITYDSFNRIAEIQAVNGSVCQMELLTFNRIKIHVGQIITIRMICIATTDTNDVIVKFGFFDSSSGEQGVYFRLDNDILSVVHAGEFGSNVITKVNWNLDVCDGTLNANNPSGFDIDPTNINCYIIEYTPLSGRVRWGFEFEGNIIYCHQLFSNNLNNGYIRNTNNPVRIEQTSFLNNNNCSFKLYGVSVSSEGGEIKVSPIKYSVSNNPTFLTYLQNIEYPVLGLRFRTIPSNYRFTIAHITEAISMVISGNIDGVLKLVLNGTLGGAESWTDVSNSGLAYFEGTLSNTITGGTVLNTWFTNSGGNSQVNYKVPHNILTLNQFQHIHLVFEAINNTASMLFALNWKEE